MRRETKFSSPSGKLQRHLNRRDLAAQPAASAGCAGTDRTAALALGGAGIDHSLPGVALGTLPPDLPVAAGQHLRRRQRPVERGMPLGRHPGKPGLQIVEAGQYPLAGTVGAAAALGRPGRHHRLVGVAQRAAPPHFAIGIGGQLLGPQCAVFGRVPLGRDLRELGRQIVLAHQHRLPGADRTAAAARCPRRHRRLPCVALFTKPPDLPIAAGLHRVRGQGSILCRVPLGRQRREPCQKVILPGRKLPVGADGTAAAVDPGFYLGLPVVALLTAPPDLPVAARQHVRRRQRAVFFRIPLGRQRRIERLQVALPRPGPPARTVGAARLTAGAGIGRRLPDMALGTAPPDLLLAAIGDRLRRHGCVARLIPLLQQRFGPGLPAIRIQ